ncbi:MAG: cyclic nucleotide-binding domain-containing protein, partial [Pseudomonadota bacterium]
MSLAPQTLSQAARDTIAGCQTTVEARAGTLLLAEGDRPDELFLILSGEVAVVRHAADGTDHILATLSLGELVGAMAFVDGEPRSVALRVLSDVTLASVSAEKLGAERRLQFRKRLCAGRSGAE